jgi:tetratricopeptide (TPR) repeat protein
MTPQTHERHAAAARRRWLHLLLLGVLVPAAALLGVYAWAGWHWRAAERANARRDFAAAQRHLERCCRVWSWDAATHLFAAQAARRAGDFDRAEVLLRLARRLGEPTDDLDLESKLLTAQRGDLGRVEKSLVEMVLAGHKDTALILEALIPVYCRTFQMPKAEEFVRRWIEREPDCLAAWLWRARVYELVQDSEDLIISYQRVIELDPENDGARLALAALLAKHRQPQEALQHLEYLRGRLGDTAPVRAALARCRSEMNQPEEARALLEGLLADDPRDAQLLNERGQLALTYESAAAAEPWFRRAAALRPYDKDVNYSLYQCLQQLNKHAEARQVEARMKRIEADLARIRELALAIGRSPHDPEPRRQAGAILMRNGQEHEAVRWLESARAEHPHHGPTHRDLADYYTRTGDPAKAAFHRRQAAAAVKE